MKKYFIEFIIIFAGVYGAFLLTDYKLIESDQYPELNPLLYPIHFTPHIDITYSSTQKQLEYHSDSFQISVDKNGYINKFIDRKTGINYFPKDSTASIMSIRTKNKLLFPESFRFDENDNLYIIQYENNIRAKLKIESKDSHITFELVGISNYPDIELIIWGPYPTTINEIIGETVGVVRGSEYSIGIQSLNQKTLGGYPWNENDCMPQLDIFEQNDLSDLSEKGKRYVLYRVEAAKPTDFGSSLQAYCRNRNKDRVIKNWGHEKYQTLPFEDGGVVGSKIALFGCSVNQTLKTISAIEIKEGLPHPTIDGEWGKTVPSASAAYLILAFGEDDIEKALDITQQAGLRYLYHPGPFETWGHFKLNKKQFPNDIKSMSQCVNKAMDRNIMLGVHTLSNFITTNDPFVTPVPDKRLAIVGSSVITADISRSQTKILIKSPDFFNQFTNNHLKTVVIGDELIQYGGVSEKTPWQLMDCQRGAFGTVVASHNTGEKISKLADHAYKVFLTNPDLSIEVSKNIADLFNQTGLRQISFDGLEGNRSTGMGNYGEVLFTQTWFDHLDPKIKRHYIADASRTSHYFWHMYTRMNWGEPWYAGFRESQTEYRLKNQKYFKRNLMPGMLGWFKMTPETSIEDIEWMLARSAAFNAGYGFVTDYETLTKNGQTEEILQLLGDWEKARMARAFSKEQKQRMEEIKNEFHLKQVNKNKWQLHQVYSYKFKHEKKQKQPGEPNQSIFNFENLAEEQVMNFILTAVDGTIENIQMEVDNYKKFSLPFKLNPGETLKYTGGNQAILFDKNWHELKKVSVDGSKLRLSTDDHTISFDCKFNGAKKPLAKLEIRLIGSVEILNSN